MGDPLYSLKDFAEKVGVSYSSLSSRISYKMHNPPEPIKTKLKSLHSSRRRVKLFKLNDLMEWHKTFDNTKIGAFDNGRQQTQRKVDS